MPERRPLPGGARRKADRRRRAACRRRADAFRAASDHRPPHLAVAGRYRSGDRGAGLRVARAGRARASAMSAATGSPGSAPGWCRSMSPASRRPSDSASDSPLLGWAALAAPHATPNPSCSSGGALCRGAARRPCRALDARGAARNLSRPAQRGAGAGRPVAARDRRDHPRGPALWRSARLHRAVRGDGAEGGGCRARRLVRPHRRRRPRLRRRSAEIHRRRRAGDLSGRRAAAFRRLRCGAARRRRGARRHGPPRPRRAGQGLPPLPFGMALHLGDMLWGNIGTADRLDFTAIGPAVNLVSRLEGLCRPLAAACWSQARSRRRRRRR